jgi:hypothetical protein
MAYYNLIERGLIAAVSLFAGSFCAFSILSLFKPIRLADRAAILCAIIIMHLFVGEAFLAQLTFPDYWLIPPFVFSTTSVLALMALLSATYNKVAADWIRIPLWVVTFIGACMVIPFIYMFTFAEISVFLAGMVSS